MGRALHQSCVILGCLFASTVFCGAIYPPVPGYVDICEQVSADLGYPCQNHYVETDDGFVLNVVRIPPRTGARGYPVILQHGFTDSASTWVFNAHASQNLGTILHDAGYDVYMSNSRGNAYSMANVKWPNASARNDTYWRYTDQDWMARFDIPAVVNFALGNTAATAKNDGKVAYVGHSQGTWIGFVCFSSIHPKLAADNISLYIAMAPTAFGDVVSPPLVDAAEAHAFEELWETGVREFNQNGPQIMNTTRKMCVSGHPDDECMKLFQNTMGHGNASNVNQSQMANNNRFSPAGSSIVDAMHAGQLIRTKHYQAHDWGAKINQQLYGQSTPPQYHLTNMTHPPTVLASSPKDALAPPSGVGKIIAALPKTTVLEHIIMPDFDHMEFVWGLNAHLVLYPRLLAHLANATATSTP